MRVLKLVISPILLFIIIVVSGSKFVVDTEDIKFYSPSNGIYVVDIDTEKCPDCVIPYVSESLETVTSVAEKAGAVAAINAGFFDPTNAKTTSYVIRDGEVTADPTLNENLMQNESLKDYLPLILNRSEFRVLDCRLNSDRFIRTYEINRHNYSAGKCEITHSIQAGPQLLPELQLEEEFFIVKKEGKVVRQSAGALEKHARSAIGIKDKHILLVAVSNEAPMTLPELAEFMKNLGVKEALAFDGGSSTSMYVNLPGKNKFILTSAKDNAARRVKSVLLIKPIKMD